MEVDILVLTLIVVGDAANYRLCDHFRPLSYRLYLIRFADRVSNEVTARWTIHFRHAEVA